MNSKRLDIIDFLHGFSIFTIIVIKSFLAERIPAYLLLPICLVVAYMLAYGYQRLLRKVNSLR